MGPPGAGTSGSCPLQGARASWGCVRVPPTLRLRFSAPRLGSDGLACHECFYTQVRTPRWFPPGRSGLTLKPVLALSALRPSGREPAPSGLCPPGLREPWQSAALRGRQGGLGKTRVAAAGPLRAAGRGGRPASAPPPPFPGAGESVSAPTLPGLPGPSFHQARLGTRAGAVTTPFWLVISSPRRARWGSTAHLSLGARPSGLPFLARALRPAHSVPGISPLEDC